MAPATTVEHSRRPSLSWCSATAPHTQCATVLCPCHHHVTMPLSLLLACLQGSGAANDGAASGRFASANSGGNAAAGGGGPGGSPLYLTACVALDGREWYAVHYADADERRILDELMAATTQP